MSGSVWSRFGGSSMGKNYTLNFDGSHNNQANKSGAGCIIRDSQGELVVAAAFSLTENYSEYCDVAIAEAVALRNGLSLAKEYKLNINLIKGDSREVIDHVLGCSRRPARPPLSQIIQQIIEMIDRFSQKIVVVDREANKVADKLASWGSSRLQGDRLIYGTYAALPPQVAGLIRQEMSVSNTTEVDDGEGSSNATNMGMAGAAVAGVAMLAWGVSKLFGESSSDDQQQPKNNGKTLRDSVVKATRDFSSELSQNNGCHTLHFSGSDINQFQEGGAGCIIRNKQGQLVIAAAYNLDSLYPDQFNIAIAEAIAWKNGLKLAKLKKLKLDLIKGDNEEVINRVLGLEKKAPRVALLSEIVRDIMEALNEQSSYPETKIERIRRADNEIANELATLGSNLDFGMISTYVREEDLPNKVAVPYHREKLK